MAAQPPPGETPVRRGWGRIAMIVLIGVGVAFAAWWLIRSDALRDSEHSRNLHELDIAARLIESWPESVKAMAIGNLLPSRIDPVHPADAEHGWQKAARFLHPRLGTIYVHYGIPVKGTCPDATSRASVSGSVDFLRDRPGMRVAGSLRTADLWYADRLALGDAGKVNPMTTAQTRAFVRALGLKGKSVARQICFKADLPLGEMVELSTTAPGLETLLLIDRGGNLLAQLGGSPLPMASVDELSRLRPLFDSLIDAAEVAASQGKSLPRTDKPPGPVVELSAPIEVSIGGHSYFAYARTLNLPAGFPATACTAGEAATAKVKTCLVMGLVPTAKVTAASLRLSPATLTSFALILGLLVALLPLLKLRLIGPGDSLRRAEVAAVALGIVTAVAIGTLTLLFAQAYIRGNQAAAARAAEIASAMAGDFGTEFAAATARPFALRAIDTRAGVYRAIEPAAPAALRCRRPNGAPITPAIVDTASDPRAIYRDESGAGWWPQLESSAMFGEFGMAWPGFVPILNRCDRGTRANVSQRGYFKAAMNGSPGDGRFAASRIGSVGDIVFSGEYRVGAVRAQPDGIEKVVVAAPFRHRASAVDDGYRGPQRGAMLETFVARTFVAPVLPAPFSFIVVDANDPALPVLFATNPSRIDVDRLGEDIGSINARSAIANARCEKFNPRCGTPAEMFAARYEGIRQHFTAQGLAGTPWVLLVHYPVDAVSGPLAEAAVFAAGAWTGLAVIIILGGIVAAGIWGTKLWQWSWPRPGGGDAYALAMRHVLMAMTVATLACVMLLGWEGPVSGVLRLLIALLTPAVAIGIIVSTLRRHSKPGARYLDPVDETAFRRLAIVLLLAVGALPMAMLWADSRQSSLAAVDAAQIAHVDRAIAANVQTRKTLMRAFGTDRPDAVEAIIADTRAETIGEYALKDRDLQHPVNAISETEAGPLTGNLRRWNAIESEKGSLKCPRADRQRSMRGEAEDVYCGTVARAGETVAGGGAVGEDPWAVDIAWFRWFCWGLLALGITVLLVGGLGLILRSLFGHGIPLEAVTYPGIARRKDGALELPDKALILNAPLALRLELLETWHLVDLQDCTPAASALPPAAMLTALPPGRHDVLVTGLALALRDTELRVAALRQLEAFSRQVDAADRAAPLDDDANRAAPPTGNGARRIVVMTDLSPLDRILQAYESEQALAGPGHAAVAEAGRREQLRWSRLFESFSTIAFAPVAKVGPVDENAEFPAELTADQRAGVAALVEEISDLPEMVIESLLDSNDETVARYWRNATRDGGYPFDSALYRKRYDSRVLTWATRVRPASRAAAIDYLRGTLIEHYQYAWIASSHAERVILDSLARGRSVNIASALALRSLVRRGLIRFAPVPRLINESFAAFVRQAEKPLQIDAWRQEQPRSLWRQSALPLMIIVPAAIIGLTAIALFSGERAIGLMPLLLGSAPALIGTLGAIRRNS